MVLISSPNQTQQLEKLVQSIDFAIRDLLKTENDPLALAMYLWTLRQHKLSLINSGDLARWGEAWIYRVFIEGRPSRKKDEQITSASLAGAALVNVRGLSDLEDQISKKVQQLVASELDQRSIPYNRPSYGAILLFATTVLNVQEPRIEESAKTIISAFEELIPGGRSFGLGFAVQLLLRTHSREHLLLVEQLAYHGLEDPKINYEDQLYLLQALWLLHEERNPSKQLIEHTEQILQNAPVWSYLMVGQEDIPPASDGQALVSISHLYRANLLDVVFRHQHYVNGQAKKLLEETYRERYIVHYCAFGFGIALHLGIGFLLAWLLISSSTPARRYWLLQDYTAMASQSALLYMLYVLLAVFLLLWTPVFTKTWWSLLIHAKIDRDRDILKTVGRSFLKIFFFWVLAIVVAFVINLLTGVFGSAFQHAIGG